MWCTTNFGKIVETGENIIKNKIRYDSLDIAILNAKKNNIRYGIGKPKVTAYKCKICHGYHIGKNGSIISDKEFKKWKKELNMFK